MKAKEYVKLSRQALKYFGISAPIINLKIKRNNRDMTDNRFIDEVMIECMKARQYKEKQ